MISIIPISGGLLLLYWLRYFFLKRKELPLAVPILFTCLFIPKLNLIKVSTLSTAGIRIDDLLALLLLIIAVTDAETWKNKIVRRGIWFLLLLSALNLASLVSGRLQGYDNNILFSILTILRRFEYFSFALAGIYIFRRVKNPYKSFLDEFTLMSVLHVVLALLQVLRKTTYVATGSDQGWFFGGAAVSTFNGYYEYGQFLCFGCAVFACDFLKNRKTVSLVLLPVSLGMLVLSGSRTSLAVGALVILTAVYFPIRGSVTKQKLLLGSWGILAILMLVTVTATGVVPLKTAGRFGSLESGEFSEYRRLLFQRGDFGGYLNLLRRNFEAYDSAAQYGFTEHISDLSAASRIYKWSAILDGFAREPVLGYGPGLTHTMDGNYFKLLAETGILGTAAWLWYYGTFTRAVARVRRRTELGRPLTLMMVSILINALMIDMFEASRPMEMIWLLTGAVLYAAQGKAQENCGSPEPDSGIHEESDSEVSA